MRRQLNNVESYQRNNNTVRKENQKLLQQKALNIKKNKFNKNIP